MKLCQHGQARRCLNWIGDTVVEVQLLETNWWVGINGRGYNILDTLINGVLE